MEVNKASLRTNYNGSREVGRDGKQSTWPGSGLCSNEGYFPLQLMGSEEVEQRCKMG